MIKPTQRQNQQMGSITFDGFKKGLNLRTPSRMLDEDELADCVDYKFNPGGKLQSRDPVIKYTDTAMTTAGNSIVDITLSLI